MASVGRNDPCPCGSGKKYKKCHLAADEAAASRSPAAPARNMPSMIAAQAALTWVRERMSEGRGPAMEKLQNDLRAALAPGGMLAWARIAPDAFHDALFRRAESGSDADLDVTALYAKVFLPLVTADEMRELQESLERFLLEPELSEADRRIAAFAVMLTGAAGKPATGPSAMLAPFVFEAQLQDSAAQAAANEATTDAINAAIDARLSGEAAEKFREAVAAIDEKTEAVLHADELMLLYAAANEPLSRASTVAGAATPADIREQVTKGFADVVAAVERELSREDVEAIAGRAATTAVRDALAAAPSVYLAATLLLATDPVRWRNDEERALAEPRDEPRPEGEYASWLRARGEEKAAGRVERAHSLTPAD